MGEQIDRTDLVKDIVGSNLDDASKKTILEPYVNPGKGDDSSVFDKIFGKSHPELYIAWSSAIGILLVGGFCSYLFRANAEDVKELWKTFIPALTLVIGYVLGNKKNS